MGRGVDLDVWLSVGCCVTRRVVPELNMYSATFQIRSHNSLFGCEIIMKHFVRLRGVSLDCLPLILRKESFLICIVWPRSPLPTRAK